MSQAYSRKMHALLRVTVAITLLLEGAAALAAEPAAAAAEPTPLATGPTAPAGDPTAAATGSPRIDGAASPAAVPTRSGPAGVALPTFQAGLWQYRRALLRDGGGEPNVTEVTKCTDPSREIHEKMVSLSSNGCKFSPPQLMQGRFISDWLCATPNGPVRFHDVLTVSDTTGYVDVSEARRADGVTRYRLEARRISDCSPKAAIPHNPGNKPLPWTKKRAGAAQTSGH